MNIPSGYSESDIAVIGMACRFPDAKDYSEFWKNLAAGKESVRFFTDDQLRKAGVEEEHLNNPDYIKAGIVLDDLEMFDAGFFGLSPKEAAIMDPQHRHFLECAWEALEDAGYTSEGFNGPIGIFGGCGMNAYFMFNILTNPDLVKSAGLFLLRHTGNDKDFLTTRVAYCLNLTGPSVTVQTACSTSLVAIHYSVQSLLNGECDMALAGGVTIDLPHHRGYVFKEGEIYSNDGHCRAFDHRSQGTIFGSGVGIVVLRRLADALEDNDTVHAIIKSTAINNDGSLKAGYFAPSVDGQAQAIVEAISIAQINPETITYMEAHGTATPIGDPIEVTALTQAFRKFTKKRGFCRIGSVKSNIGHLDTAAGVAGFIKTVLAFKHKQIPASLHYEKPNPRIDFENSPFLVNATLHDWEVSGHPRRAGISSLGVGGTNAHIIIEEAPPLLQSDKAKPWQLLVWSAKSQSSLDALSLKFASFLSHADSINLADASFTLQRGRNIFPYRQFLVCTSAGEVAQALHGNDNKRVFKNVHEGRDPSVIFMFTGQGSQYVGMSKGLYEEDTIFRDIVDECAEILEQHLELDIRELLFPSESSESDARKLEQTMYTQPALFVVEYALAQLFISVGIKPAAMIGHSVGEYVAACLSGVFNLEDALFILSTRARLMQRQPPGSMLSVRLSEPEIKKYCNDDMAVAVINSPNLVVLSGTHEKIHTVSEKLSGLNIENKLLHTSHAYHSKMMEPALEPFIAAFSKIKMHAPSAPFISNLSGTWITKEQAVDPQYWAQHLRNTVRFADGLGELLKESNRIFLELGPGNTLCTLLRSQSVKINPQNVISSVRHPREVFHDYEYFLTALGKLWIAGAAIDWSVVHGNEKRRRIPLPTYAFDHQPYWIEPGKMVTASTEKADPLEKVTDLNEWFYKPVWKNFNITAHGDSDLSSRANIWLIFDDERGFGSALCTALKSREQTVVTLRKGTEFKKINNNSFVIRPGMRDDYSALVKDLSQGNLLPTHLVHLFGLDGNENTDVLNSLETALDENFYSLLFVAQALGNEDLQNKVRWITVSDGIHAINKEPCRGFHKAVNLGPVRLIPKEFPDISCLSIDLETACDKDTAAGLILSEFTGDFKEQVVAYRNNQRLVSGFEKLVVNDRETKGTLLKKGGVYLLTGGLGGIAITLAKDIAAVYEPKLVLLSRRKLPAPEEWRTIAASTQSVDSEQSIIRKLVELQDLGADVVYFSADVADFSQMEHVFSYIKAKYGVLNGIIHAAGTIDDGVILFKQKEDAARVLAPKVRGTLVLRKLAEKFNPEFFVLFSSASSILAPPGQVDYAAANSFLDAFAHANYNVGGMKTIALNWGQWQEVGMAARMARSLGIVEESAQGTKSDHPLLGMQVKQGPDVMEFSNTINADEYWILNEHKTKKGECIIPGTAYLELALASLKRSEDNGVFEMKDTFFFKPCMVANDEKKEIKIRLTGADGSYEFVIMSRSSSAEWDENVSGTINRSNRSAKDASDFKTLLSRCTAKQVVVNNSINHTHLNFGPRWKNLKELHFGKHEAVAVIELPPEFAADMHVYKMHPALLDTATGCAQALAGFNPDTEFYLPFSYSKIIVYKDLPQKFYSHIRYRTNEGKNSNTLIFDVTIFGPDGNVIIDIDEFIMKKTLAADDQAKPGHQQSIHQEMKVEGIHHPVNPKATGNTILQLGQKAGMLPAEGVKVFNMILENPKYPQYIVVSQDLNALYESIAHANDAANDSGSSKKVGESSRPKLSTAYEAPTSDIEKGIAEIWREVLGIDTIGIRDDFLELGGHSLLLTRIVMRIRKKFNVDLALSNLFEAPTIADFAQEVVKAKNNQTGKSDSAITPVSRDLYRVKKTN